VNRPRTSRAARRVAARASLAGPTSLASPVAPARFPDPDARPPKQQEGRDTQCRPQDQQEHGSRGDADDEQHRKRQYGPRHCQHRPHDNHLLSGVGFEEQATSLSGVGTEEATRDERVVIRQTAHSRCGPLRSSDAPRPRPLPAPGGLPGPGCLHPPRAASTERPPEPRRQRATYARVRHGSPPAQRGPSTTSPHGPVSRS
jgi:hypothetical protein